MEKNPAEFDKPNAPSEPPPSYYPSLPPQDSTPQPQMQQPTVVTIVQVPNLGSESTRMTCPHCRAEISTRVQHVTGTMTHVIALLLCVFGFWCCACIPYCTDGCMDADHECPNCNKYIGHYKR